MKRCPVCGKAFYVQFPDKWQYKRANQFICSWRCIRLLDKGETNMPKILTDEQKAFAVQLVISGTDPRPYLMSCGSNAPEKLWSYIKQTIREKDPETYQKLPATLKGLRPPEDADPAGDFVDGSVISVLYMPAHMNSATGIISSEGIARTFIPEARPPIVIAEAIIGAKSVLPRPLEAFTIPLVK